MFPRKSITTLGVLLGCCLIFLSPVLGDYYFYGVGDDDVYKDNDTLWNALEPYPEWSDTRCTLRDNWDADDGDRKPVDYEAVASLKTAVRSFFAEG